MLLAVNGSLMRGFDLNRNLLEAGAVFIREDWTAPIYRLWSIGDRYPGMLRTNEGSASTIALEIWEVTEAGLVQILEREPPGLTLGRVVLEAGNEVLGVLAESYLVEGRQEITSYGGWRGYLEALTHWD
jgi:gamma-glutamylcyclotransferase (GGCT)/AIG2-like uncharacterized protein YtfP